MRGRRMNDLIIRDAEEQDTATLLEIYAPYVTETAVSFEYESPSVEEFHARIETVQREYPYLVAEKDGLIIGYAYASPFHPRPAYKHCAVATIYLDRNYRRQGIGRELYRKLEMILLKQNVFTLYACITIAPEGDPYLSNDSEKFHFRIGYRTKGTYQNCGYKFGRWYSVIWMEKQLAPKPDVPDEFIPYPMIRQCEGE